MLKKVLQYVIPLALAGGIFYALYASTDINELLANLQKAHYGWLALSMVPMLAAHIIRGWRWDQLLQPLGYRLSASQGALAVLAGYFANLLLPRLGEVIRCGYVRRSAGIPVEKSLGTVVTERIVDLALMASLLGLAFLLEFSRISTFFGGLLSQKAEGSASSSSGAGSLLGILAVLGLVGAGVFFGLRRVLIKLPLMPKIYGFVDGLLEGLLSILKLPNRGLFIFQSVAIWFCFWLSTWIMLYGYADTATLGPIGGLVVLVVGTFGFIAPVQGGIGAYHFMISAGLTQLYGLTPSSAMAAALMFHSMQTLFVIVVGGAASLVGIWGKKEV